MFEEEARGRKESSHHSIHPSQPSHHSILPSQPSHHSIHPSQPSHHSIHPSQPSHHSILPSQLPPLGGTTQLVLFLPVKHGLYSKHLHETHRLPVHFAAK